LGAELDPNVRTEIINYMLCSNPGSFNNCPSPNVVDYVKGGYFEADVRYAIWLIMCSPDFARN
jgi:hypothetical protein